MGWKFHGNQSCNSEYFFYIFAQFLKEVTLKRYENVLDT